MKTPRLNKGHEYFDAAPVVQSALKKHFCKLNGLNKTSEKLMELLNEGRNLTHKEADLIWEPKE